MLSKARQCRSCGSTSLTPVFSLDGMGPASKRCSKPGAVEFALCDPTKDPNACGLLQRTSRDGALGRRAPSAAYRANRNHLRCVATEALETLSGRDCAALDIGCNDGTLLSFYPRWVERYGVDTSDVVSGVGEWAKTLQADFASSDVDTAYADKKFDILTAISVLEYVDEPRAFLARMKALLADDGVIIIETLYAPMALARTGFEAFVSGAASVYSLAVLERLVTDCGLKIFRGMLTDKEGGSIRLFLTHEENEDFDFDPYYARLARLWDEENALSLRTAHSYHAFYNRAILAREAFKSELAGLRATGETAHLLTSCVQSVAVHQWAGEAADVITAAVSHTPPEVGAHLCENGPILISETECRAAEPDFLIAPAPLKREVLERWREAIMLGARIIVATPEPHIIDSANFAAELGKSLAGGENVGEVETLRAILAASGGPRLVAVGGVAADGAS
ncbi:MAG: class I SAM-dependent methyltransferase [Pseudomonadota bacterium]